MSNTAAGILAIIWLVGIIAIIKYCRYEKEVLGKNSPANLDEDTEMMMAIAWPVLLGMALPIFLGDSPYFRQIYLCG